MPLLSITTNIEIDSASKPTTLKTLSEQVSQALGKPEQYVMISLKHNPDMLFAGSNEPLAYLELKSIGLPQDQTTNLSDILSTTIETTFGIKADRIYIEFANAERHMWGWNHGTF